MYEQAEVARLTQQREAEAAERNADRVAALLTHLASKNPQERLLATRFVDYLVRNNLFPKELLDQQVFIDLVEDKR